MNLFQQKQTSLYKPELNQDISDLKNHFSAVAITAAKETFLKSSLIGAPQPRSHLTGDLSLKSQKHPNLLKRLWHDQITTQQPVGPRDTITKLSNMKGPTTVEDPLNQPLLPATVENTSTVSITTSLPATLSTILVTSTINDHQENSTKWLHQMLSSTPKGEDNYLSSPAQTQHEISVTPLQFVNVSKGTNFDTTTTALSEVKTYSNTLDTAPTVSPEILKNSHVSSNFNVLIKSSTDEDISQSLQVTEKVSTVVSTISSLHRPGSKNEPLTSKALPNLMTSSPPPVPAGIPDGEYFLWSTSTTGADDDFPAMTEMPAAHIHAVHSSLAVTTRDFHPKHPATGHTTTPREQMDPRRLSVDHIDGELYDISRSGKIGPASTGLKIRWISNHDRENATAKQSVLNQTPDSGSISGFSVIHPSKRKPVCPYPPLPAHGTFYFHTIPNPAPFQYKHYIQYACYAGYTLANGDVYSYCLQDGQWSGVTPMCIGKPPLLQNLLCLRNKQYDWSGFFCSTYTLAFV